jgi:hypothetical protein
MLLNTIMLCFLIQYNLQHMLRQQQSEGFDTTTLYFVKYRKGSQKLRAAQKVTHVFFQFPIR